MMGPEPEFEAAVSLRSPKPTLFLPSAANGLTSATFQLVKIQAAADKHKKPVMGFSLGPQMTKDRINRGWRLLMIAADGIALVAGQTGRKSSSKSS